VQDDQCANEDDGIAHDGAERFAHADVDAATGQHGVHVR
jgi:hypothetical protein